jgi:hypothetical protein
MMAVKMEKFRRAFPVFLALLTCLLIPGVSHAYSAVAGADEDTVLTIYAGWNFSTQKEADSRALAGCRAAAKKNGMAKAAANCKVSHRQKGPGGGAIVCGKTGCSLSTGYDSEQDAVDRAYQQCEEHKYVECQKTGMTHWWDEAGYPKQPARNAAPTKACGPPPGRTVRSTYQCNNGDCTRTFENGCTVRFQAPYCHDPLTGKWEWKADGC